MSPSGKCPVTYALDIIGDRWSLLILRDVLFRSKCRFSEFSRSAEKIATNILSNRLARMESEGILARAPDTANRTRVIYSMTPKGADLIPVILDLIAWSARYDPPEDGPDNIIAGGPPDLLDRLANDRDGLIADLRASVLTPGTVGHSPPNA